MSQKEDTMQRNAEFTISHKLTKRVRARKVFPSEESSATASEWIERVQLKGEEAFKLDTGAEVTAIPSSMSTTEKHGTLQAPRKELYGPATHTLEVKGCFKGKLCQNENNRTAD